MRFFFLIFFVVAVATAVWAHHDVDLKCTSENEIQGCFMKEKYCGTPTEERYCVTKCICAKGFARKGADCILEEECEEKVQRRRREKTDCEDKNEVYLYCGSKCPARCGDKPGERVCATECIRGCFCKKGFVLNRSNKCVKPDKC